MGFLKKYWYIIMLLVVTLGLGVVTYLTSQKLTETEPVAPNVAQVKPKAAEQACTYSFSLPVATPTPTQPASTSTPTHTPGPTSTPLPTATPQPAGCNNSCSRTADCQAGYICDNGACRNPSCTIETDCVCNVATPTPTNPPAGPTPTTPPTPQVPVSGTTSTVGIMVVIIGAALLLLGLAF